MSRGGHSKRQAEMPATQSNRAYLVADKRRPQQLRFAFDCEQRHVKLNVNGGPWGRRSILHSDRE
jgi:hypothetical protein